ncbi:NAD-dependent epimerase/dehydratase family protein [bacterium]|nr:NAD-dependent epimerase/dehydratase family protein [bacterium]
MNILVTGGGGFLGQVIVRQLLDRGERVTVFSRGDYPQLRTLGVNLIRGDIRQIAPVRLAVSGMDAVIHTAARVVMWGPYQEFYTTNVIGTKNLLEACRILSVPRFIYTSSPSVAYGRRGCEGIDENAPYPVEYDSFYSQTKAEAERLVLQANDRHLATCALRPHLIWGPEDNNLVVRIVDRARSGRLRIVGRGDNLVDTTYVDNAAEAHLLALDRLWPGSNIAGRTFFISQDQPMSVKEMINRIVQAAGLPSVTQHISVKKAALIGACCELVYRLLKLKNEPPMTRFLAYQLSCPHWFDLSAAKEYLGYQPRTSIDQGMTKLAQWLTSTP